MPDDSRNARSRRIRCRVCSGHGQVHIQQGVEESRTYQWRRCSSCNGNGYTIGQGRQNPPPRPTDPPPKIGPSVDELLQQFGTYKKPPQPPQPDWLTAEQLASGVKPSANPPEDAPSEPASPPDKPPESEPSHLTEEFPTHYPGASADRPQSQPPPAVPLNQQEEARQREAERQQQAQQQELARQQEAARQREQARQLEQYQQRALARPPRRRPKEPLRYKVFRFKQGIRQRARRTARAHWFRFGLLAVLGAYALYGLPTVQALAGIDASTWHPWLVQAFTLPYIQSGVGFPALIALLFFTTRFGLLDWLGGFRWFVVLSILGWVYRVELIGPLF